MQVIVRACQCVCVIVYDLMCFLRTQMWCLFERVPFRFEWHHLRRPQGDHPSVSVPSSSGPDSSVPGPAPSPSFRDASASASVSTASGNLTSPAHAKASAPIPFPSASTHGSPSPDSASMAPLLATLALRVDADTVGPVNVNAPHALSSSVVSSKYDPPYCRGPRCQGNQPVAFQCTSCNQEWCIACDAFAHRHLPHSLHVRTSWASASAAQPPTAVAATAAPLAPTLPSANTSASSRRYEVPTMFRCAQFLCSDAHRVHPTLF